MINPFIKHPWIVLVSIGIAAIMFLAFAFTLMAQQNMKFIQNCQAADGHEYYNGKTWLCLDGEGRIVEVTP